MCQATQERGQQSQSSYPGLPGSKKKACFSLASCSRHLCDAYATVLPIINPPQPFLSMLLGRLSGNISRTRWASSSQEPNLETRWVCRQILFYRTSFLASLIPTVSRHWPCSVLQNLRIQCSLPLIFHFLFLGAPESQNICKEKKKGKYTLDLKHHLAILDDSCQLHAPLPVF